ncbi:MAG TPA: hypothetical protein DEQ74_01635 [Wolbachia sp.]|uniref:hypothetical protein n=1 Tax=Wolbachia endosymbiont of Pentalonia nigronervosa TaxID=1301914 RepID=UPI000EDC833F|nr:hypothetical protein [Wolbachia endosymbiont of Pentalonia nigronervosa]MBD0391436.1 hypothetical protein [Wolbachia endosymbiont of Pentalonia nigronervosa]HCE59517.1 hypothetical protein [Wolbachia sp.]
MRINRKNAIYLVYAVISISIMVVTVFTLFYPSLFYLATLSSLSSQEELAIRVMSCVGSLCFLAMTMASLLRLHETQHVENETSEIVICNSFAQSSEIVDQPPSYSEVIEMDKLPSYSDAVKISQSKCDGRIC